MPMFRHSFEQARPARVRLKGATGDFYVRCHEAGSTPENNGGRLRWHFFPFAVFAKPFSRTFLQRREGVDTGQGSQRPKLCSLLSCPWFPSAATRGDCIHTSVLHTNHWIHWHLNMEAWSRAVEKWGILPIVLSARSAFPYRQNLWILIS